MSVTSLYERENNGKLRTPEQMLEEALSIIRGDDECVFKGAKKMMVISLNCDNDSYNVNWLQAGMHMSECVALCEVAKTQFLSQMEYVVTPENIDEFI